MGLGDTVLPQFPQLAVLRYFCGQPREQAACCGFGGTLPASPAFLQAQQIMRPARNVVSSSWANAIRSISTWTSTVIMRHAYGGEYA